MRVQVPPSAPSHPQIHERHGRRARPKTGNRMIAAVTVIHVLTCVFLIIVVLLQSGRGADVAAAFGGMGSQTAFGPRGSATVLTRATTWSAIIFMITSITLSVAASRRST